MSSNIVVVGSCMIDFTCYSPRLPKSGETILGNKFQIKYGGKGANQCIAAAKLGASTSLVASLGSDFFAQDYLEILKKENVNTSHIQIQKGAQSGIAHITVADNGENCIVIVPGANDCLSPNHVVTATELIKNATVLLCQFETPLDATLHALRIHKGHGLSIVNAAPAIENIDPEIFELCDVFCVNETEAEAITKVRLLELSNAQEAIDVLLSKGCNLVILTLGPSGAVYASKSDRKIKQILTAKVHPIDTTIATKIADGDANQRDSFFGVSFLRYLNLYEERQVLRHRWHFKYASIVEKADSTLDEFVYQTKRVPATSLEGLFSYCSTQGAGDAFLGSFAYFKAYHPHLSTYECIQRACEIATRSVLKTGTHESFPIKKDLPEILFV